MTQPAQYWRESKDWKNWLGKRGKVVDVTRVHNGPPGLESFTPYSLVLVAFAEERRTFIAAGNEDVQIGATVACVLRKLDLPEQSDVIHYGVKVSTLHE